LSTIGIRLDPLPKALALRLNVQLTTQVLLPTASGGAFSRPKGQSSVLAIPRNKKRGILCTPKPELRVILTLRHFPPLWEEQVKRFRFGTIPSDVFPFFMPTNHPTITTNDYALDELLRSRAVKRIPTLDGWRGIAILLVLIDHARFALHLERAGTTSTGQHGVAMFFVLSGFLITGGLMREKETTGSIDLRAFYSRRFFRLMPCALGYLWFCLIISLMSPARTLGIVTTLSAVFLCRNYAATFLPEFPLNGHFWSLSIEEQFYLVWPLLLILTGLRRAPWIAIAGTLAFASYRFAHWSSLARLPLGKTFGTEFHADALLIGCTMALFLPTARRYLRSWMALPPCYA
jgi:hypothetical protein